MNHLNQLALAAAVIAAFGAALATGAYAGSQLNGPQLTGMALQSLQSERPAIMSVILPSGHTIDLRS